MSMNRETILNIVLAALLIAVQERMRSVVKPIGNLPHDEYGFQI